MLDAQARSFELATGHSDQTISGVGSKRDSKGKNADAKILQERLFSDASVESGNQN